MRAAANASGRRGAALAVARASSQRQYIRQQRRRGAGRVCVRSNFQRGISTQETLTPGAYNAEHDKYPRIEYKIGKKLVKIFCKQRLLEYSYII